jgi:quinoprotein glucose dehydrogenase
VRVFPLILAAVIAISSSTAVGGNAGDWPAFGNDPGGTKFSPLTQITTANVTKLAIAWTYDTGEKGGGFRGWSVTPVVIDNVMYFGTYGGKLVALDAATGAELWKFDLKTISSSGRYSPRGISYWPGDAQTPPRVVATTTDGLLTQVNAKNGELVRIGDKGYVDLKVGVTEKFGGGYNVAAPPAIFKDMAILAPATGEQGRYGVAGDIRSFDLKTGKELWRFHTVPQPGEANFGTWGSDGWQDRRGPGSWVNMTVDVANGLVFVPMGQPTDQNFGNSRPGINLYSSSLVALEAATGRLKWYFQMTHHDVYDWDANAPPTLIDVNRNGTNIPALAQSTKQGLLFILNRLTGEPIFGVEEKPVPRLDAPGDQTWPTQPFPLKPPPISRTSMTREEVNKTSRASEQACKALYDTMVQSGPYTPYGMVPSLVFPSSEGGGSWSGASFDPTRHLIFVNTRSLGTAGELRPSMSSGLLPSFGKVKIPFDDPEGYPCSAPPWGELMAISADTADIVWRVPLGEYSDLTKRGVPKTGTPNAGGPIVTASGVLFIGSTTDQQFRAFDSATGKELWSASLPNDAIATPLTYMARNGKQYVATVAGGGLDNFVKPRIESPRPNVVVAFKLR